MVVLLLLVVLLLVVLLVLALLLSPSLLARRMSELGLAQCEDSFPTTKPKGP